MDLVEGEGGTVVPVDYKKEVHEMAMKGRKPGLPIGFNFAPKPLSFGITATSATKPSRTTMRRGSACASRLTRR